MNGEAREAAQVRENPPDDFKETEIGPIPVEWEVVRLGDIAALSLGRTPPRKEEKYWTNGTVPWVTIKDLNNGIITDTAERISLCAFEEVMRNKIVPAGTLLLSFKLTIGKVGILGIDAVHNEAIVSVVPDEMVALRDYLFFLLQAVDYDAFLDTYVKGKTLSKRKLNAFPIPLPPLPEQRRIAHVLSTIQRAIAAQDNLIVAAREVKRSLMQRLFTYGPGPEPAPTKQTEIGEIPEHWEVVRLGEVVTKTEKVNPKINPEVRFRYVDVSSISRERLRIKGYTNYTGEKAPSRARKLIRAGDIIFATVRPYLKRIAVVPFELDGQICSTAFCVIRPNLHYVDASFLFYAVANDRFVARVSECQRGSSYPAVTDKDVLNETIPLPPLPEQRRIAHMLSAVDRKIEAEERRKAALQALFKTMLHQLMTGRVRVKK
jgi:type I restriction enzyme S subunit